MNGELKEQVYMKQPERFVVKGKAELSLQIEKEHIRPETKSQMLEFCFGYLPQEDGIQAGVWRSLPLCCLSR